MEDGSNPIQLKTNSAVADNSWHHIVAVWSGGTDESAMTFYVDGTVASSSDQTTNSITTISNTDAVVIGSVLNKNKNYNGQIDDLRIYNIALTGDHVSDLFISP